jgi:hypothetical protein
MVIQEIMPDRLSLYAAIPMKIEVRSIFRVRLVQRGLGGIRLIEEPVENPYVKDYDSYGETPLDWPRLVDVTRWAARRSRSTQMACICSRAAAISRCCGTSACILISRDAAQAKPYFNTPRIGRGRAAAHNSRSKRKT